VEFGIFNDEGLLEGGFTEKQTAYNTMASKYADDKWVYVAEICPDHEEQDREHCEVCAETESTESGS
jgi:hypothetical protein